MKTLVEEAFSELAKLPAEEQETFAAWILQELAKERRWQETFERSSELLDKLAEEARAEYQKGLTLPLNPDKF